MADGVMLDEAQLMPLVEQLPAIWEQFRVELINFAILKRNIP